MHAWATSRHFPTVTSGQPSGTRIGLHGAQPSAVTTVSATGLAVVRMGVLLAPGSGLHRELGTRWRRVCQTDHTGALAPPHQTT